MSQNVIKIIEGIFQILINFIEDDDKYRIAKTKRYLHIEESFLETTFDIVSSAKLSVIKTNNFNQLLSVSHRGELYVVFPEKYSAILEVIDLIPIDNVAIEQGIGILALGSGYIALRDGISSLEIIDQCLEIEVENDSDHVDFSYKQVINFFEGVVVAKIENSNFKVEYIEDFLRMYAIMLTICTNNSLTKKTYDNLRDLLYFESSRSISESIISVMQSEMNEYKFLALYHCIEYLFIIHNAREIANQYEIDQNVAVDIVISENFRTTEMSNLTSIITKYASEISVINFYDVLIDEGECENKSEKVSKFIYKARCNIAHLRYKQEQLLVSIHWKHMLENISNIILSIYQNMNSEIVPLCKDTNAWNII